METLASLSSGHAVVHYSGICRLDIKMKSMRTVLLRGLMIIIDRSVDFE